VVRFTEDERIVVWDRWQAGDANRLIGRDLGRSAWRRWTADKQTGDWWPVYTELASHLSDRLRTPIEIIDLGEVWFAGVAGEPFHLTREVSVRNVWY